MLIKVFLISIPNYSTVFGFAIILHATKYWDQPREDPADLTSVGVSDFIVGGTNAAEGEFPHQISLLYNGSHNCGGSIISSCWIVTAAHCVVGFRIDLMTILSGTTRLSDGGIRSAVRNYTFHENYNGSANNIHDVAVIRLQTCLQFNSRTQPIQLNRNFIGPNVVGTVSGWGYTNQGGTESTDTLKKLTATTISNELCQTRFRFRVPADDLCTYNGIGFGFCQGDSGGPLIHNPTRTLIGIVSSNVPCAVGSPDLYARVSSYVDWIQRHANL